MPELPEVETVKNTLKQLVVGKTIMDVTAPYSKIIRNMSFSHFRGMLINETIVDIKRKGKLLIFVFQNHLLVSHLRMEGKYFFKTNQDVEKHEHIIFWFTDGTSLRYHDTRKFGTMDLFPTNDFALVYQLEPLSKVGLEPMDAKMTVAYLEERFHKSTKAIKTVLLDQSIMAGLGNIYVDEVLFLARIHPQTPANKVNKDQIATIITSAKTIFEKAIALGGTTIRSFTSAHAVTGRFQNSLLVHTKTVCPVCFTTIKKIKVGGRGTYVCENCQKPLT
ncbi:MAG: DNA-formamidopyrimidine glycosylase [Bacilli bacterium]